MWPSGQHLGVTESVAKQLGAQLEGWSFSMIAEGPAHGAHAPVSSRFQTFPFADHLPYFCCGRAWGAAYRGSASSVCEGPEVLGQAAWAGPSLLEPRCGF